MNKQIEEMAKAACTVFDGRCANCPLTRYAPCPPKASAERLYNAGYRKQIEGEWISVEYEYVTCSSCGHYHWSGCDSTAEAKERLAKGDVPNFCPNCGAKMKGGE